MLLAFFACVCLWWGWAGFGCCCPLSQKRDESEQQEAREDLKNEIMSVVESRIAACRQALCAALDDCTAEIKAGVTEAVSPEAVQVGEGGHTLVMRMPLLMLALWTSVLLHLLLGQV